ncbi:[protein-PII] uridylyltransferase [Hahella sp. SMD15-11]|uniref:Bifunctional uridylyltransferase/uridylyl-removing enzyme n=1 Tax=Thermohahella caldifontis TaxID=3142973 RepID=A0AB39UZ20_9GAMM
MDAALAEHKRQFLAEVEAAPAQPVPLRKLLETYQKTLDAAFDEGADVEALIHARSEAVDAVLGKLWTAFDWPEPDRIALLAVGGYGRSELLPHSDVDLLVLLDDECDQERYREALERFVPLLWDLKLDIGLSVRTISETIRQAAADITIATNLLETRTIAGSDRLRIVMSKRAYSDETFTDRAFYLAKRDEQKARHTKYGDTEYNLEPNVKTSPGSLRDIQTLNWITKRHFGFTPDNQSYSFLTPDERKLLRDGERFLWQLRWALHSITGRNENRLLFDLQRAVAEKLHFTDSQEGTAVEKMMQRYYRYALGLAELNDVVLQYYDQTILGEDDQETPIPLNRRFHLVNDYIEVTNDRIFGHYPFALIEIFLLMAQHPEIRGIRASTIRLMREERHLIDEDFRKDLRVTSLFVEILKTPHALHKTLSRMRRYGILGRYLPEFGRIIGKMQHDLFHIYTVDDHTIKVIRNMVSLQSPGSFETYPLASRLVHRLPKLELLYIAGLYHDIAKGRGGDHSELGAKDVERFCKRHHLSERDTRLVSWLVRNHLLMSMTAQRKDPSDPDVVHEFASKMDSQVHLDYLYVLTVCDISATNPKLWNTWRGALLRQLYTETVRAMRKGLDTPPDRERWIQATQAEAIDILRGQGFDPEKVHQLWDRLEPDYFLQASTTEIAWQTAAVLRHTRPDEPLVLIRDAKGGAAQGYVQILIFAPADEALFAATTATLEQLNLNIVEARIYSHSGDQTLSTFVVAAEDDHPISQAERNQIKQEVFEALDDPRDFSEIIHRRTPRKLRHFSFPTEVTFSNDTVNHRTLMEVITPDRPGLLARIGRVLLEQGVRLVSARIATLGERVEDVFVVTDEQGAPIRDAALCQRTADALKQALDNWG